MQSEAHALGSDVAATVDTEAEVYAAEASDKNDLLEKILPAIVDDYMELVRANINAGSNHRFTCRQLLLLGAMFDFYDTSYRKAASAFLAKLWNQLNYSNLYFFPGQNNLTWTCKGLLNSLSNSKCPLCLSWFKQPVLSPCNHLVCSSCKTDGLMISSEYALGNTKYAQIDLRHVINSKLYGASIDLIEVAVILPKQQQTMSNCYKIIHKVALEVGISPNTLTTNINLQEGYMAPDVQHEIVSWLKAHAYTGAFHKGEKLITSTLRDKVLENPFEADVLVEQDLQVKATAKAILKDVEGADGALESQALEVAMEEDIPAKAKASAEASDVVETAITLSYDHS
ncbi:hypothetical protein KIW84_014279 [Lathyrus oleraceus]|uniref:Zinc finger C3HC4 RING-type domain-containing protein n=1 Tax=Pisum sativum TaxID=3888 RepID=A0A9D5BMS7_PEA|nr:hypothetical protein KIW84_014279 [Pisum sativum]